MYQPESPCLFGLSKAPRASKCESRDDLSSTLVFVMDGCPYMINADWEPSIAGQVKRRAPATRGAPYTMHQSTGGNLIPKKLRSKRINKNTLRAPH